MVKEQTLTSIDSDLKKLAKEKHINISAVTENALREKLNKKQVEINAPLNCEVCGEPGIRKSAEDVRISIQNATEENNTHSFLPTALADQRKLTWLYPDEKWICNACLLIKIKSVGVAHA